jgi:TetR/AcrR family transcriptional repressor of lmrAB and yxaGH operons
MRAIYGAAHTRTNYDGIHNFSWTGAGVMAKGEVRERMILGAVRLLAERGLEGTSFAEVLELTGAPRGSTYHHFPGGKSELVAAALELAGSHAISVMEPLRGQPAPVVVQGFMTLWRRLLEASRMRSGCAVLAVTVAGNDDELLADAGRIFRDWREHLASLLVDGGLSSELAAQLAALTISASEGAVAVTRAEQDWEPFDLVEAYLVGEAGRLATDAPA